LGSSNLTEGGLFTNYEVMIWLSFDLAREDAAIYQDSRLSLDRFLNPTGPTVQPLTEELVRVLVDRGDVISEVAKRRARRQAMEVAPRTERAATIPPLPFGTEAIPVPPPLPAGPLGRIVRTVTRRSRKRSRQEPTPSYDISAFYMHLNRLQGPTIPGEARIPIAARRIAEEFWGWPGQYQTEYRSRGQKRRRYQTWKPVWKILDMDVPEQVYTEHVRMYEYADSLPDIMGLKPKH
jgi:hypothetical protein